MWTLADGKPLGSLSLAGHEDNVLSVTISPEDKFIVTVSEDNTAIVWPMVSAESASEELVEPIARLIGHKDNVIAAAVSRSRSPDPLIVLTASKDNTIRCWHVDLPTPE